MQQKHSLISGEFEPTQPNTKYLIQVRFGLWFELKEKREKRAAGVILALTCPITLMGQVHRRNKNLKQTQTGRDVGFSTPAHQRQLSSSIQLPVYIPTATHVFPMISLTGTRRFGPGHHAVYPRSL